MQISKQLIEKIKEAITLENEQTSNTGKPGPCKGCNQTCSNACAYSCGDVCSGSCSSSQAHGGC